jgi:hypothetical protein
MRRTQANHAKIRLRDIGNALIAAGYYSLGKQAKALGVGRSTAWNIVNGKNKCDRLAKKTTDRILANPETPPTVRKIIKQYLDEKTSDSQR